MFSRLMCGHYAQLPDCFQAVEDLTTPTCARLLLRLQRDGPCGAAEQQINPKKINSGGRCALFKIHQTLITKVHVKMNQNIIKRLISGLYQRCRNIHQGD